MAALAFIAHPPHPLKMSWIWLLCQNSLARELKIRFVGLVLRKLLIHDTFQLLLLIVSITEPYVDGCCLGFYLFLAV